MRILTVTHFYESHGGGIERVAGQLCRNLAALGHDCGWAASSSDPAPIHDMVRPVPLACINPTERQTGLPMPVPGVRALRNLAREISQADAVIVHDALYCTSIAAMVMGRLKRKPVILIQHIAEIQFASKVMRKVMRLANAMVTRPMLRGAHQAVFISETVRSKFAAVKMRRPARLLFNGVDTSIFHCGQADRSRFGLPPDGKVAVFAGRFVEKKGLAVLRACAARKPETTFVLAGSGPINPAKWNLANVVLPGALSQHDVASLFCTADVLLLPSVGEGYPLVIQEAMACGLPIVCGTESAKADPAAQRWMRGVHIELADAEGTAERVCDLLEQPLLSSQERRKMSGYASAEYSWRKIAKRIAELVPSV